MGRTRKRVVPAKRKGLPKIYSCPKCGGESVKVVISREKRSASVICGNEKCNISADVPLSTIEQAVDAFCKFADLFHSGKLD